VHSSEILRVEAVFHRI